MRRSEGRALFDRIESKIRRTPTCWLWIAPLLATGYGRIKICGRTAMAHRAVYELMIGPIPDGLTLDHLCRNRACVNPAHLEPVTLRENVLRGDTITATNHNKTLCHKGHPLSGANLFIRTDGRRRCRTCERASQRKYKSTAAYRAKHAEHERSRRAARRQHDQA